MIRITTRSPNAMLKTSIFTDISRVNSTLISAFHIRLGDYKNAADVDLDVCSVKYYQRAIERICKNVEDPTFFVFTNDARLTAEML